MNIGLDKDCIRRSQRELQRIDHSSAFVSQNFGGVEESSSARRREKREEKAPSTTTNCKLPPTERELKLARDHRHHRSRNQKGLGRS